MAEPLHPHEALHEAADGRLDAAARAALDRHLAECEACRAELEAIRWTKAQVAAARNEAPRAAELDAALRHVLANERGLAPEPGTSTVVSESARARGGVWRWAVAATGLAAAILLAVWALPRLLSTDVPTEVASKYQALGAGTLTLGLVTEDVGEIEAWFSQAKLPFDVRVFDLGMMQYRAVGGQVVETNGRPSALFVYRGPEGQSLVCQMYEGRTAELPEPTQRLSHNDIDFLVYEQDGLTLVFWQEGKLVCVLTGAGDPKAVIDLAFAKALKV